MQDTEKETNANLLKRSQVQKILESDGRPNVSFKHDY